ncbi:MAG TPA: periplasmic heavy metal sensor [Micavibrio sp.]
MNRHMKIIFTLSLLLNVTLLGVIAGAAYKRWDRPVFSSGVAVGDAAFQEKMAQAMAAARKGQEPLFRDIRAAKKLMQEALAAEPFDEAAFMAASENMRKIQAEMFAARNKATLAMARDMNAEERKALAAHFKAMGERFGKNREGRGREARDPEGARR